MYDTIIIGAGPAGMTAALYAARAKKKILIIEALVAGGQIINVNKIDNYPTEAHISGFEFAEKLYNQIKAFDNVEIKYEKAFEIIDKKSHKIVRTNKNEHQGKTVIIATGASRRKLGIEKEDYYLGKGLSYCATCDGAFFKDKIVAVIGKEENSIEDTLYLADIAKKVYFITPEEKLDTSSLKGKENIEVILGATVTELIGEKNLKAIHLSNDQELEVDGLFVLIGQVPANEVFGNLIKINSNGYIVAGEDCHTNIENIFVAGDNRTKNLRQLVTATSDGANAATEAIKALQKETP